MKLVLVELFMIVLFLGQELKHIQVMIVVFLIILTLLIIFSFLTQCNV